LFILAAACLPAEEARADWDPQLATSMNGAWLRRTPALASKGVSTSARAVSAGALESPSRSSIGLIGLSGDFEVTVDDRWKVLVFGGSFYWALGSYDTTVTSIDGSIATLQPWTTVRGDLLLPGVGRRWKHRRTMWAAAVRTGIGFMAMGGEVGAGADRTPLPLGATGFLVELELEACHRLDPTTRVCVQVAPRLYDHELMNGLTFGLRMEWGR
jgi:hypothetical protein